MKSVFDKIAREELISRIKTLDEDSKAQWGKMNVYQMLKHCTLWEEMISGKLKCKRIFLGRVLGKMALKSSLKNDKAMMRNAVTSAELIIKEKNGNVEAEKEKWITLIKAYDNFANHDFTHPFFGKMTTEQIGYHAYKHTDHHLRQFNC